VIEITHLGSLFPAFPAEAEAIQSFSRQDYFPDAPQGQEKVRIVCVDPSKDLVAELNAFLSRSGYEVLTTRYIGDAATLVRANRPRVLICGPGMLTVSTTNETVETLRRNNPAMDVLQLPPDFHTTEAGQAGEELLSRLRALLAARASA
jgi:hypothetical protein